jgi:hypothetical protein
MDGLRASPRLGTNFVWLGDVQDGRTESLYVDIIHYTAGFSRELAWRMYTEMRRRGVVRCEGSFAR